MRTFIGLAPDWQTKLAIAAWRDKSFPRYPKATPPENFHITIAFLGNIPPESLESFSDIKPLIAQLRLNANFVGYFSKPGIGFLGIEQHSSLLALKEQIHQQLPTMIKPASQHKFIPHITLFRGLNAPMAAPLMEPGFVLQFSHFHLFESVPTKNKVIYRPLLSW